tara:strand:+ start:557 stop:718 length:162 start_codon:yes stop_codon:yes gene_type:complete
VEEDLLDLLVGHLMVNFTLDLVVEEEVLLQVLIIMDQLLEENLLWVVVHLVLL